MKQGIEEIEAEIKNLQERVDWETKERNALYALFKTLLSNEAEDALRRYNRQAARVLTLKNNLSLAKQKLRFLGK